MLLFAEPFTPISFRKLHSCSHVSPERCLVDSLHPRFAGSLPLCLFPDIAHANDLLKPYFSISRSFPALTVQGSVICPKLVSLIG